MKLVQYRTCVAGRPAWWVCAAALTTLLVGGSGLSCLTRWGVRRLLQQLLG